MRTSTFLPLLLLFCLISCEKDDFVYSYPETNKLLISVTRTQGEREFSAEFKYDSLNRLIEVKNIFPAGQGHTESFIYNDEGKLIEKNIENYKTTYIYNRADQLIEQNVRYTSTTDEYEWDQKTEFKYKHGRINKGIEYSREGEAQNHISYKYDSRGNTIEKIVRPANNEYDFALIEIKFRYDSHINPNVNSGVNMLNGYTFIQHADIKQINNPVYFSFMNAVSSSMPPEFNISYEYDSDGLPLSAEMNNVRYPEQEPVIVEYKYRDKE